MSQKLSKFKAHATKFFVTRGSATNQNEISRERVDKDSFEDYYGNEDIIQPPIGFNVLYSAYQNSDALQASVATMRKNIDGFGFELVFRGDDLTMRNSPQAVAQYNQVYNLFEFANDEHSFQTVRYLVREDDYVTGNYAFEVIRRPRTREIAMLCYMPIVDTRMCRLDEEPTSVKITVPRNGQLTSFFVQKRFRRFVQVSASGSSKLKWFKSFGDPRPMDATTGEYKKNDSQCTERATELLWVKNNFGGKTYGMPIWIGSMLDVLGRSLGQYINYDLFDNQGIPPMLIIVENGSLTDESKTELQDLISSMRGSGNFNKVGLIEAVPEITGLDNEANVKINIKNMIEYRNQDLMFQNYLKYTADNIRQAFRLPALYVGGVNAYSYSTAMTAQMVAEQQIFIPARRAFDEIVNRKIVWDELKCYLWEYRSKGPQTVGAEDMRLAVREFSNSGALSINNSIDILNNMLGMQISKINTPWGELPYSLVIELVKQNRLQIPELENLSQNGQSPINVQPDNLNPVPDTNAVAPTGGGTPQNPPQDSTQNPQQSSNTGGLG